MRWNALLGLALVALAASPAGAANLTGTWDGSFTCQSFNGESSKLKVNPSVLTILQEGSTLSANLDNVQTYRGGVVGDAADPEKRGQAILNFCGTDDVPLDAAGGELVQFKVKVDPEKGTGTLTGTSIFEGSNAILLCKLKYKRSSTTPPKVEGCVPPPAD